MTEEIKRIEFTKEMKENYTILLPHMLSVHFAIISEAYRGLGYNMELLTSCDREIIDEGLKYVHNDTCYPALLVIGQFIHALKSGKYDLDRTAVLITQTGGGCRASNYIHLLRKALANPDEDFVVIAPMPIAKTQIIGGGDLEIIQTSAAAADLEKQKFL